MNITEAKTALWIAKRNYYQVRDDYGEMFMGMGAHHTKSYYKKAKSALDKWKEAEDRYLFLLAKQLSFQNERKESTMTELRECPKCWYDNAEVFADAGNLIRVRCNNCGLQTNGYTSRDLSVIAWNARAPDPRLQSVIEELMAMSEGWWWNLIKDTAVVEVRDIFYKHIPELKEE